VDANNFTDPEITDYLLGVAVDERTERIDELIFVDEGFGTRVNAIERDLIDEYIRNELDAETRRRFEGHYLRSPIRRERFRLAGAIGEFAAPAVQRADTVRTVEIDESGGSWPWWKFAIPAFAAAAILLAVALPLWLNSGTTQQQATINADTNTNQLAQIQPTTEPSPSIEPAASPAASQTPANQSVPPANENRRVTPPAPRVFALSLAPQLRGSRGETRISIPPGTDTVSVTLQLEATEFATVNVELRDKSSGRVLWRGTSKPSGSEAYQTARFSISSKSFKPGSFNFTVSGTGPRAEIIGTYPFVVVP
jgi:hypothetical protein